MMARVIPFSTVAAAGQMTFRQGQAAAVDPLEAAASSGQRWSALMAGAQDGDQHAYHTLLLEITPYLRILVRRYLGAGDEVEDALQEILLVVHRIRHTYERGRPFKPWLSTIASRRIIDLLRGRAHRLRHEVEAADETGAHGEAAPIQAGAAAHAEAEPDQLTTRAMAAHEVQRAVAALPARQREAVELLRLKELSLREAAGASGQSAGALKVACHRALKALRLALGNKR